MLHNGETKAESAVLPRKRSISLPEAVKDVGQELLVDALSGVGDAEAQVLWNALAPELWRRTTIAVPTVSQSFSFATHLRQMLAISRVSFRMIATSLPGLFLLVAFPMMLVLMMQVELQQWGVPLLPRTIEIISRHLTFPLTDPINFWVMVPLHIIFFAGELVWRERDARLNENIDAAPVPEWVLFLGKYLGLCVVLVAFVAILTAAGMLTRCRKVPVSMDWISSLVACAFTSPLRHS